VHAGDDREDGMGSGSGGPIDDPIERGPEPRRRTGSFLLSYVVAGLLLLSLLHVGGVWYVLANTRVLDTLIRTGVVALTDADAGVVQGVPDLEVYLASQDPIDWSMLLLAAGVFCAYWAVKSLQFHQLGRFTGAPGDAGVHARAYLYGLGVNRCLPFDLGDVAAADALENHGASRQEAARTVFLAHVMIIFEIAVFAAVGLWLVGVTGWLAMLFWSFVILAVAWFLVRPDRARVPYGSYLRAVGRSMSVLANRPAVGIRVAVLSLIAFALEDVAAYVIAQAFTSENVILNVDNKLLIMALVAGYIARLVPFTPGGIGQFEWAFAAALYAGGVGLPEAVTIAILDNAVRYVTGTVVLWVMTLRYRSGTDLRRVLARSSGNGLVEEVQR
jgi:uncharacterized membrane protein YbhN (UPF0104 family)